MVSSDWKALPLITWLETPHFSLTACPKVSSAKVSPESSAFASIGTSLTDHSLFLPLASDPNLGAQIQDLFPLGKLKGRKACVGEYGMGKLNLLASRPPPYSWLTSLQEHEGRAQQP